MNRRTLSACLIGACCALTFAACETEDPPEGRPGTTKWHWMGALDHHDRVEFTKMVDELQAVVAREDPEYQNRAIWFRLATLHGLGQGHKEIGDAFRAAMEENEDLIGAYQNAIQQGNRDARTYAIQLAESLGDVEKLLEAETVTLDFAFPAGEAAPSPVVTQIAEAQTVQPGPVTTALNHELKRGIILAATQLAGEEDAEKAKAKYDAGPIQVSSTDAKFTVATMLLDTGLLFSKARIFDPKIRNIFLDRAEMMIEPFAEAEDKELQARAEEFAEEVEDERRDIAGKARRKEMRE